MKDRIKIPFVENSSKVPVVKIILNNGAEGYAVVDTGSESTVFDMAFVKANKSAFDVELTEKKISLVGMMNNNEMPIVNATAEIKFEGYGTGVCVNGLMLPLVNIKEQLGLSPAALIGSDLLSKLGAKISFRKKMISINNDLSGN